MLGLDRESQLERDHFDLTPLRAEILDWLRFFTLLVLVFWIIWVPDLRHPIEFVPPSVGLLVVGLTYVAQRHTYHLTATLYLTGLVAFAVGLSLAIPSSPAWYFLGPLVILASILLGSGADLIFACVLTIGTFAFRLTFPQGVASDSIWIVLGMIWFCAMLSFAASRPLYLTLDWSWHSFVQASQKMEEARLRQYELGRLSKSLNESYLKLEEISRELEYARKVAEEARRLKSQFAVSISHEMRTPLNLIIGFSEMMTMAPHAYGGEILPPAYRTDVNAIYRSARHLSNLIDDVLDLAQIEAGRMGLHKEWISLIDVTHEAVATVSPLYERKRLRLSIDLPDDLPPIYADQTRVRQILINLLSNATRFTSVGGVTVSGSLETPDERHQVIHLVVSDTGIGIDEREIDHLFEEFRQFGDPSERDGEGSGLGLAISKRFTQLHGGAIWAESTLGIGTKFHVNLPVVGELAIVEYPSMPRLPRLRPADVEDAVAVVGDAAKVHLFQRYLDGYEVLPATDPRATQPRAIVQVVSNVDDEVVPLHLVSPESANLLLATCVLTDHLTVDQKLGATGSLAKPVSREILLETLGGLGSHVRSLLIVDDDHAMVDLVARMIKSASRRYRLRKAYSGQEAIEILRRSRPDAVLLDLLMPDVDGYGVLAWIKGEERLQDLPVIVVSGQGTEGRPVTANRLTITTKNGLSIGQLMACLKASLQAIEAAPSTERAPVQSAARTE